MLFNFWRRNPQDSSSRSRGRHSRRRCGRRQPPTRELLESRLAPATYTWTGARTLSASGYAISGDALTLQGDTTVTADNTDNGTNTLGLPLDMEPVFVGTQAFFDHLYHVAAGATLQVTGQMSGAPVLNFVEKTGPGTLVFSGTGNNFGGSIQIDAGTLAQGVANATPPNPCIVDQGATFDLRGFDATLGSLSGAGTVSAPPSPIFVTLTTGLDNSNTTFSGTISGPLNLVKAGQGVAAAASKHHGRLLRSSVRFARPQCYLPYTADRPNRKTDNDVFILAAHLETFP
jgi:autotransporter-associated beta strand protein